MYWVTDKDKKKSGVIFKRYPSRKSRQGKIFFLDKKYDNVKIEPYIHIEEDDISIKMEQDNFGIIDFKKIYAEGEWSYNHKPQTAELISIDEKEVRGIIWEWAKKEAPYFENGALKYGTIYIRKPQYPYAMNADYNRDTGVMTMPISEPVKISEYRILKNYIGTSAWVCQAGPRDAFGATPAIKAYPCSINNQKYYIISDNTNTPGKIDFKRNKLILKIVDIINPKEKIEEKLNNIRVESFCSWYRKNRRKYKSELGRKITEDYGYGESNDGMRRVRNTHTYIYDHHKMVRDAYRDYEGEIKYQKYEKIFEWLRGLEKEVEIDLPLDYSSFAS